MTTKLEQALADLEGERSEESFERWRSWSAEYAGTEEGRAEIGVDGAPDLPQSSRGVWVVWLLASIFCAGFWWLLFQLGRWIVRVVYG